MGDIIVREYRETDRESVRQICLATAMVGRPANLFFDGDEILADALTAYYTDHEPESCFVAESDGKVVGYLLSSTDTRAMDDVFWGKILWPLLGKAFHQRIFYSAKNWRFFGRVLSVALKGGYWLPSFADEYPAALHINILEEYRGKGAGERLVRKCLDYLGNRDVRGARLATMSERAGAFFQRYGFRLFYSSTRPYFQDVLKKDVPFRIYGRKIE